MKTDICKLFGSHLAYVGFAQYMLRFKRNGSMRYLSLLEGRKG